MTSIQIPPEAVQSVVAQAILEGITPEVREKILSDAIATLILTPPRTPGSYATPKAPLQEAFDSAVRTAVMAQARQMVEDSDTAQAAIKKHVSESITALCEGNYEGLPEAIGGAIGSWLRDRAGR